MPHLNMWFVEYSFAPEGLRVLVHIADRFIANFLHYYIMLFLIKNEKVSKMSHYHTFSFISDGRFQSKSI